MVLLRIRTSRGGGRRSLQLSGSFVDGSGLMLQPFRLCLRFGNLLFDILCFSRFPGPRFRFRLCGIRFRLFQSCFRLFKLSLCLLQFLFRSERGLCHAHQRQTHEQEYQSLLHNLKLLSK